MRRDKFSRRLMRENHLHADDLIYPVFVLDGEKREERVPSMPGVVRQSLDLLLSPCRKMPGTGNTRRWLFFRSSSRGLKNETASEALNPSGLVPRVVSELKKRFPELGIITDIALDPYTSHGQDGLIDDNGYVMNEETVTVLTTTGAGTCPGRR